MQVLASINRSTVDYWSLDTEGSELRILEATDFELVTCTPLSRAPCASSTSHQRAAPQRVGALLPSIALSLGVGARCEVSERGA